jgi:PAS domain-containing protein
MARRNWMISSWKKYHEQLTGFVKRLFSQGKSEREIGQAESGEFQYLEEAALKGEIEVRGFVSTILEPAYKAISNGEPVRFVRKHGKRWIEYILIPGRDREGNVDRLRVDRVDITKQKQLNETVRNFERRYCFFLDQVPPPVQISDLSGNMLPANDPTSEMTGYSLKELQSMGLAAFYAQPETWKQVIKTL